MGILLSGRSALAAAALVLVAGLDSSVSAQYFGQNKVQYKKLDFKVLKTQHFDIYFYPSEREGIDIAARLSERWLARLERVFEHQLRGRQPLVLYASHTDFEQNIIIQGELGEGTGGVTEPLRRRIVLPFGGPLSDTDHVIGHELVHAFQFDITTNPNAPPGQNGAERLPLWFIEGMAEYLSLGPVDPNTAMWLRDAVRQSASGGNIHLNSDLSSGSGIDIRSGAELLSLLNNSAPGPGGTISLTTHGADITVSNSTIEADRGDILISNLPPSRPSGCRSRLSSRRCCRLST